MKNRCVAWGAIIAEKSAMKRIAEIRLLDQSMGCYKPKQRRSLSTLHKLCEGSHVETFERSERIDLIINKSILIIYA